MRKYFSWLFSIGPRERKPSDPADKLLLSMRTTAKCRYNAAERLRGQGRFSFFTTTTLSLGLVFVPLVQNARVPLAFTEDVLNALQIFLGVSVMVYSIVIGTSKHDLRYTKLTTCGDKIKELIRDLEKERDSHQIEKQELSRFQEKYAKVVSESENHERNDYRIATLEMPNDYFITGLPRILRQTIAIGVTLYGHLVPIILISMEIILISDMLKLSSIIEPFLNR